MQGERKGVEGIPGSGQAASLRGRACRQPRSTQTDARMCEARVSPATLRMGIASGEFGARAAGVSSLPLRNIVNALSVPDEVDNLLARSGDCVVDDLLT